VVDRDPPSHLRIGMAESKMVDRDPPYEEGANLGARSERELSKN
jgi:hypothetical protein